MTTFKSGDRIRVVEHDEASGKPREGGRAFPGEVADTPGIYVLVNYDDRTVYHGKRDQFYAESGWRAWDGQLRWRLMPATDETAATAGEGSAT